MMVDQFGELAHLHARDTSLVLVSIVPTEKIEAYRERMGWDDSVVFIGRQHVQSRFRSHHR